MVNFFLLPSSWWSGAPHATIVMSDAFFVAPLLDQSDLPFGLCLHTLERVWEFSARDAADREAWMAALTARLPALPMPRHQGVLRREGGFFQSEWVPGFFAIGFNTMYLFEAEADYVRCKFMASKLPPEDRMAQVMALFVKEAKGITIFLQFLIFFLIPCLSLLFTPLLIYFIPY